MPDVQLIQREKQASSHDDPKIRKLGNEQYTKTVRIIEDLKKKGYDDSDGLPINTFHPHGDRYMEVTVGGKRKSTKKSKKSKKSTKKSKKSKKKTRKSRK